MKTLNTLKLFNLPLVDATTDQALDTMFEAGSKKTVAFLNAHCVNVAAKDRIYAQALRITDMVLPDGSGLSLAAKMVGKRFTENLNGTDLFAPLMERAAKEGKTVFFLGGQAGVAERAAKAAQRNNPDLMIAGCHHGFFSEEDSPAIVNMINATGADIVLVALGVPKQDVWIYRNRRALDASVVMGVGAMLDFHSGRVSRAPEALRKSGLEWTYRLAIEPRRMAKRYLIGNPVFVARAAVNALRTQAQRAKAPMPKAKRLLDITVASGALLALSPFFIGAALAVKMTSRGPVLFRQTRVGLNGEHFEMIKFRSMYIDAEERRAELLKTSDREGVCFKSRHDPRITPVGRFIRRFSIDELPQILNVIKGDMSLVGPRPGLPSEVANYSDRAALRLRSVPGITGIWQVSGRADVSFERMIEMDISYGNNRSIFLDLMLLAMTARAVIGGKGAY